MDLRKKLEFHPGWGSGSTVGKVAQGVTNAVGGKGITDYVGGRGTKRGLAQGVANVAMAVGTGGAGILKAAAKKGVTRVAPKAAKLGKNVVGTFTSGKKTVKIKQVPTQFFENRIPGTKGYSAGYVKGKPIK
jgi:hypothetical protein